MLQRFVANWLRQHAQEAIMQGLNPTAAGKADPDDENSEATVERREVDIACFFPVSNQAAGLVDLLSGVRKTECNGFVERVGTLNVGESSRRIAIIETALPHERLALVVRDVITLRKPSWVLASGFAVGIDSAAKRGLLLVANRLIDAAGYSLAIDTKITESKGLRVGTLLTADAAAAGDTDVEVIAQDSQAAVIGEVCRVLKAKMMAVHCIAKIRGQSENVVAKKIKSQDSIAGLVGAAAGALIDQPSSIKGLWNESETKLVFSDRLAKFLSGIISQLPKNDVENA